MGGWTRPRAATRRMAGRVLAADRWLLASGVLMVGAALLFALNIEQQRGPLLLLWLPNPLSTIVIAVVFRRTSRIESLPLPTRRFWRHLSIAAVFVGIGCTIQMIDALRDPYGGGQHTPPVMLAVDSIAITVILWALFRLPLGVQSRGERLRVALDSSTVMLATAVFIWHFQTRPLLNQGAERTQVLVGSALVTVLALVAVFAVAKVVLSSYAYLDKSALRLLAFAILIGVLSPMPQLHLQDKPHLLFTQASIPALVFFAAWAAERQRQSGERGDFGSRVRTRRPFSVLPYAAVASVDALLLFAIWTPDSTDRVVAVAAVALTAVVVLRQLNAFQDNRRLLARLDHGATHDALTQLPNRVLLGERLQEVLRDPAGRSLSLALIDLDDFKLVNDTLGHEIGDALLVAVAQRLADCVRTGDTVARFGGDEFVVVLDGVDRSGAERVANRILASLARPVVADGHDLLIRASIGIVAGRPGDDASELLRHADIAMYTAKNHGGSRFEFYQDGMGGNVAERAQLGSDLRHALAEGQLFLLYQPIVALDGGRLTGVEALLRWAHPRRGTIAPADFIPVAERSGLIVPLGRWILREACRQIAAWSAEHGDAAPAVVNVNVSARELREPGFADFVAATLADTGIPASRLALEVTETTIFELGDSVTNLRTLRQLGIRIALDDFGTGHSTLTLLQDCPVDELKLDRSFTQADANGRPTIAAAVMHLAHALGLDLVAEGVETFQQADRLRGLGYETAQGFFFARPMPPDKISESLRNVAAAAPYQVSPAVR